MCIIWIKSSFVLLSQNSKDTICLPVEDVKKIYTAAEQNKLSEERINLLNKRITNYQGIISNLNQKDSATKAGHKAQLDIAKNEKEALLQNIGDLNKSLIRERRKKKWAIFGGLLTTGIAGYLWLTK